MLRSIQLNYPCGGGFEPPTSASLNEVRLIYGTFFNFNILKKKGKRQKVALTLRVTIYTTPITGTGLEPAFQFWIAKYHFFTAPSYNKEQQANAGRGHALGLEPTVSVYTATDHP